MQKTSLFLPISEAPLGTNQRILIKTVSNHVFVAKIDADGNPRIYDFCSYRYVLRDDWEGIIGWMPIPD